ncbi:MAG: bacteriohemerythrin [Terracidiphilus sp.]
MPLIVWTDRMSVGVKLLDNDHKKLVLLVNNLHDGIVAGHARPALECIFGKLVDFTRLHFSHEERLLAGTSYQGWAAHRQEHDQLLDQLMELQARFLSGAEGAKDQDVMNRLRDWLFKHTQGADQDFVSHLKAKGLDSILVAWDEPDNVAREKPAIQP